MYPMVCQTCGFPIADLWIIFFDLIKKDSDDYSNAFKILNIRDECCRRMFRAVIPGVHKQIK